MKLPKNKALRAAVAASAIAAGLALGPLIASCLPGDTRPVPGVLHFTVEPSEAVSSGLTTGDGWTITFERLLIGIGGASIGGPKCNNYSGARYDRLLEATTAGEQKLSEVYGLGTCSLRFRVRSPSQNALLGEGVGPSDLDFMKKLGDFSDPPFGGTSVYVQGTATRAGATRRFAWQFRQGYSFHDCGADGGTSAPAGDPDAGDSVTIEVVGGAALAMPIRIQGEELFRAGLDDDAGLRFEALAGADLNDDEEITLEELSKLPSPVPLEDPFDAGTNDGDAGDGGGDAGAPTFTLFLYRLLPRIIVLTSLGRCTAELRPATL